MFLFLLAPCFLHPRSSSFFVSSNLVLIPSHPSCFIRYHFSSSTPLVPFPQVAPERPYYVWQQGSYLHTDPSECSGLELSDTADCACEICGETDAKKISTWRGDVTLCVTCADLKRSALMTAARGLLLKPAKKANFSNSYGGSGSKKARKQ